MPFDNPYVLKSPALAGLLKAISHAGDFVTGRRGGEGSMEASGRAFSFPVGRGLIVLRDDDPKMLAHEKEHLAVGRDAVANQLIDQNDIAGQLAPPLPAAPPFQRTRPEHASRAQAFDNRDWLEQVSPRKMTPR
jgi:hypothetical protein